MTRIGTTDSCQSVFSLICLLNEHINVIVNWGIDDRHNDAINFVLKFIICYRNTITDRLSYMTSSDLE